MSFCPVLTCSQRSPCQDHHVAAEDGPDLTDVLFDLSGATGEEESEADECLNWLERISASSPEVLGGLALRLPALREQVNTQGAKALSGSLILQALNSVRELSEYFGLDSLAARLMFEKEARKNFSEAAPQEDFTLKGTTGGVYCPRFLRLVQPLYDMHMGVENMGPLLYSLVRFVKPRHVLEIGAGYTSIFLLQALKDNFDEMQTYSRMQASGRAHLNGVPWTVADYVNQNSGPGMLHTVDNMAHEHTTAHKVREIADELALSSFLTLHEHDAFTFCSQVLASRPDIMLDLVWIDLGAAHRMRMIMKEYWPRVNPNGGFVCVHSTLTNQLTRGWLEQMRMLSATQFQSFKSANEDKEIADDRRFFSASGVFETMSFLEPHKCFQNSVSMFQKRGEGFTEPLYTKFP